MGQSIGIAVLHGQIIESQPWSSVGIVNDVHVLASLQILHILERLVLDHSGNHAVVIGQSQLVFLVVVDERLNASSLRSSQSLVSSSKVVGVVVQPA